MIVVLTTSQGAEEQPVTITVSAAASLTEAFTDIAEEFEAKHPDTMVELNFAGSGTLRMQIEAGAPIDVFCLGFPEPYGSPLGRKSDRKQFKKELCIKHPRNGST